MAPVLFHARMLLAVLAILALLPGLCRAQPAQDTISLTQPALRAAQTDSMTAEIISRLADDQAELGASVEALRTEISELSERLQEAMSDTARFGQATSGRPLSGDLREAQTRISGLISKLIRSVILIIVIFYLIKSVSWLLEILAERDSRRRLLFKRLIPITRVSLWALTGYVVVVVIFDITGEQLIAASAAVGVAVGFASQDILKNIFGGLIIILDKPFQVGDKINVGGTYGEVVSIGLRATRIQTPDDNLVSVPNAQVVDGQVSNANAGNLDCQVVTHLYLPGWVDVMKAKRIAYEAAANSQYVYLEKPVVVIVEDEFKETFLTHLMVKAYVIDTRFENRLMSDVTETAKAQFLREGMLTSMGTIDTVTQSHLGDDHDERTEAVS